MKNFHRRGFTNDPSNVGISEGVFTTSLPLGWKSLNLWSSGPQVIEPRVQWAQSKIFPR